MKARDTENLCQLAFVRRDKTIRPKISMRTRNFTMYTRYKIMTGIDKQLFLLLNQLKEPSFLLLHKANLLVNPLFTYISVYLCTF